LVADQQSGFLREHSELKPPLRSRLTAELIKTVAEREAALESPG